MIDSPHDFAAPTSSADRSTPAATAQCMHNLALDAHNVAKALHVTAQLGLPIHADTLRRYAVIVKAAASSCKLLADALGRTSPESTTTHSSAGGH